MVYQYDSIFFKKKVYKESEINGKLTHLKIIHIRLLSVCREFLFQKCYF